MKSNADFNIICLSYHVTFTQIAKYGRQLDLPSESPLEFSDSQDLRELSQETEGSKCSSSSSSYAHRPRPTKEQYLMDNIKKEEGSPSKFVRKSCLSDDTVEAYECKGSIQLPRIRYGTEAVAEKDRILHNNDSESFQLLSLPENPLDRTLKRLNKNEVIKVKVEKSIKFEDDQVTNTMEYDFHDEVLPSTSTSSFASDFMC